MLDDAIKAQLTAYLERLTKPLELTAWLDDSDGSRDTAALLADIAAASPKVTIVTGDPAADERRPSFGVAVAGEAPRVRFAGLPLGHEFTSLVLALLHVGGHPPRVSDEALAQITALEGPLHFETYFSQSCQNCP
ncbi:MAG: alkyl hydroperoxide reductase subunit F, partial [Myxococcales bacterium]|nr:alkyl hydroperoxide reductase subunit F [Myxococcales bacterium]